MFVDFLKQLFCRTLFWKFKSLKNVAVLQHCFQVLQKVSIQSWLLNDYALYYSITTRHHGLTKQFSFTLSTLMQKSIVSANIVM